MSDVLFPKLPGLTFEYKMRPTFSTIIQKAANRTETRIAEDLYPIWEFDLTYEFLRDQRTGQAQSPANPENLTEVQRLVGFYIARRGSYDSFLLDLALLTANAEDSRAHGAVLGTGDGATTDFQLLSYHYGVPDEVQAPRGTPVVYLDGAIASAWSLQPNGIVRFATAPASGVKVAADFSWYYRVRFAEDSAEFESFSFQLFDCQTLKLVQVRQ